MARALRPLIGLRWLSLLAAALASIACEGNDERTIPAADHGAVPARNIAPSADSIATPPGVERAPRPVLAEACVRGDPSRGVEWKLEGAERALSILALQPIAALASRDSARLAARLASATDALPSDTTRADFRGLPVVVHDAWRIVVGPADTVVVAFVARRLPMESNPLEELFTLVATPGVRQGVREPLLERWFARDVGREESLELRDLLAAYARVDGGISLAFVREAAAGPVLEIVTRETGAWRLEWSGAVARCN